MDLKNIYHKLGEFEALLQALDQGRRNLVGNRGEDDLENPALTSMEEKAHFAFDDIRLGLVRKYDALRPIIRTYSRLFTAPFSMEVPPSDPYEIFIEKGTGDLEAIYADLKNIRRELEEQERK